LLIILCAFGDHLNVGLAERSTPFNSVALFIFLSLILKGRWPSLIIRQNRLLRPDKLPVHIDPKEKLLLVEP